MSATVYARSGVQTPRSGQIHTSDLATWASRALAGLSRIADNPAMSFTPMACRPNCAACCIAPSISSPTPAHPQGKPAGVPCGHLDAQRRCTLFGSSQRPAVCSALMPEAGMCRESAAQALQFLTQLEIKTRPRTP